MHAFQDFGRQARTSQAPATAALTAAIALAFIVSWFTGGQLLPLAFDPATIASAPWTVLTYPFASLGDGRDMIWVLFLCLWFWGMGGAVERDLGTVRYLVFWFSVVVLGALFHWVGFLVVGESLRLDQRALIGAFFPVSAVTVAWGVRNPFQPVLLMFVLPIQGRWIALLSVLLVFFGTNSPQLAVFAVAPLGLVFLFATDRLPFLPWQASRRDRRLERRESQRAYERIDAAIERQREREEKERLRRIFEQSLIEDPDSDQR
jgi:membrane associated rhomboid family serine protease